MKDNTPRDIQEISPAKLNINIVNNLNNNTNIPYSTVPFDIHSHSTTHIFLKNPRKRKNI